jgi:hypothetical protein
MELASGVVNLHAAGHAATLVNPRDGSFSRLTKDELDVVHVQGHDPSKARGMFVFNVFNCTLDQTEKIIYALNQDQLYSGVYDSYSRHYTSDFDAYASRTTNELTWDTDMSATILGSHYNESLRGGVRRIPQIDPMATPFGPYLVARTWMPTPANFPHSDKTFDQDYQIEVYYERKAGEVIHLYGIWRQMNLGTILNLSTENDEVVATTVGHLEDWDSKTAELCALHKP